jgi:hypothetical protein
MRRWKVDALVTLANILNVAGYLVKDRLWVRSLSFSATCCLAYYFTSRPEPLVNVVCWNLFFAALNAVLLWRLVADRLAGTGSNGGE